MACADAGIAATGWVKDELGPVVPRAVVVVATVDIVGYRRGAGSDRRSHTIITEPKSGPFHRNAEFVCKSDKLFPKHRCKFGEHSLFSPNIEPPRKSGRLVAEESSPFRCHGKQSRLCTADLVWRASALNDTHAKWLYRHFHLHTRRSKEDLRPKSRMLPA